MKCCQPLVLKINIIKEFMGNTLLVLGVGPTYQSKLCLKLKVPFSLQGDGKFVVKAARLHCSEHACPVNAPVCIY